MKRETLHALLTAMLEPGAGVSDLLFIAGKSPLAEVDGKLIEFPIDTPGGVLDETLTENIANLLIDGNERLRRDFEETGACDGSYGLNEIAQFRVNVFKQCGHHAVVMRRLPSQIPTLDSLGLPPVFKEMLLEKNGIILITGGTGTGKTTTLAAMLNELNATQQIHIVTLEDPIEFFHTHHRAAFSQRELGKDFPNFAAGLRSALRQAPKVILVGEIRDRETLEIAMSASETGHIVFSTMHTVNAGQTVNRILGMFEREEEQQLRQRLSETLRYVVSQRLVDRIGGGRHLVTEVMGSGLRTRETIVYGESEGKTFQDITEAGSTLGWHTFDQSLIKALTAGIIDADAAITYATSKPRMRRHLDQMKKQVEVAAGESSSGLKLQIPTPAADLLAQMQAADATVAGGNGKLALH